MQLGILTGEASGDILGASVARELRRRDPSLSLSGIGGPLLTELGLDSLHPMDRLSVFGYVEPLKRLPELLRIRSDVYRQQLALKPDCFLGVDSPDFNLTLEQRLRERRVTTAHLVSPSVWAWRSGRMKKIAQAVDLMLCLLPFELQAYEQAGVPAVCVGHPLIEELAELPDRATTRRQLGLPDNARILAVLPGSRGGEVGALMPVFVPTLQKLSAQDPAIQFLIPAANATRRAQIEAALAGHELPVTVIDGQGRAAMHAADWVMLASGTATLEAMLLRKPMVIAYRMSWLSWQLLSRMAITQYVGLPNVLAGREVVPELLQEAAHPDALLRALNFVIEKGEEQQLPIFEQLAEHIGGNFAVRCADALEDLVERKRR